MIHPQSIQKPKRRIRLKNHFLEWYKIDLIALGVAIGLLFVFFIIVPSEKVDLKAFIGNITTEIFGAWISVRIIGYIIENNSKKRNLRQRYIGIINYLTELITRITRDHTDYNLVYLEDEIKYYWEYWNIRQENFTDSEKEKIMRCYEIAETIYDIFYYQINFMEQLRDSDYLLSIKIEDELNNEYKKFSRDFQSHLYKNKNAALENKILAIKQKYLIIYAQGIFTVEEAREIDEKFASLNKICSDYNSIQALLTEYNQVSDQCKRFIFNSIL
jgi:hypothetical protein